jgi:hypothetical protein
MQLPDRPGSSKGYRDVGDSQKQKTTLSIRMPFDSRDRNLGQLLYCSSEQPAVVVIVPSSENREKSQNEETEARRIIETSQEKGKIEVVPSENCR